MKSKTTLFASLLTTLLSTTAFAHVNLNDQPMTAIYADLELLKTLNIPVLYSTEGIEIGYTVVSGATLQKISDAAHLRGRCGNFEALSEIPANLNSVKKTFTSFQKEQHKNLTYEMLARRTFIIETKPEIVEALNELKADEIRQTVTWLSNYPDRYNKAVDPNKHIEDFANKLRALSANAAYPVTIDLVSHNSTKQKSVRMSIKGSTNPNEIIVLGGHLDSINQSDKRAKAPGADDNASGSASILEAARVLLTKAQPQRTIEFMWYAGEESGLLGSAEIAATYKKEARKVIAVLQLDMTSFPGNGPNRIASMTDFTSPWLRDYLKAMNMAYLDIEILDDKCGYGCSDHASWHKNGYPALMPTEAKFDNMFHDLHTTRDVINDRTSFEHALIFSKIAVVMAMDLGNSTNQEPVIR